MAFTLVALLLAQRTQSISAARIEPQLPAQLVACGIESFGDLWVHASALPDAYAAESRLHLLQGAIALAAGSSRGCC